MALLSSAAWAKDTAAPVTMGELDGSVEGYDARDTGTGALKHINPKLKERGSPKARMTKVAFSESGSGLVFSGDDVEVRRLGFGSFEDARAVKKSLEISKHPVSIAVLPPNGRSYDSAWAFGATWAAVIFDTGEVVSMNDFIEYAKKNPLDPYAVFATKRAQERKAKYLDENYCKQLRRINEEIEASRLHRFE